MANVDIKSSTSKMLLGVTTDNKLKLENILKEPAGN